jgi:D-alanyl-lipoteichoic acid acyltransferase DltB (MBOAT superfamily)
MAPGGMLMLFNSFVFLFVFLPLAIIIYALADSYPRARMPVLIGLSLVFYGYWDPRFLVLIILSILANWLTARLYDKTRSGVIITLAIFGNLSVLGVFKYSAFFAQNFAAVTGFEPYSWHFALPLGISFFTFHHVMYLIDLRRGRAPIYPLDRYALYICFFPQAISGPLARWNEVMHQFGERAFGPGWERRAAEGTMFIVIGLVEKVLLSDPLAQALDPIYKQAAFGAVLNGDAWAALGFAFQVFFDFAGYSDIAIGLGLIFGVQLPHNFDAPFRTTSLLDFWQRWHMTLARFLRDYVFTPISKVDFGGRRLRIARVLLALLLTMSLCGLWHGAGWTYVIWGTLQGVGLVFAAVWRRHLTSPPPLIGWAATVAYFMLTAVVFRAPTLEAAWHIFEGLAILPGSDLAGRNALITAAFCAIVLPPSHEIVSRLMARPCPAVAYGMAALAAFCLLELGQGISVNFIYFQF